MTHIDHLKREILDLIANLPIEKAQKTKYEQAVHQGVTPQIFEEIGTLIKTEYAEKSSALSVIEAQIDAELQAEEEQRQAEFDKHKAQLEGEDVFLKEIGTQITQGMDTAELEAVRRQLHE